MLLYPYLVLSIALQTRAAGMRKRLSFCEREHGWGFSSFSSTCLCVTDSLFPSGNFIGFFIYFFYTAIQHYYLGKLCNKGCVTAERAQVVLIEVAQNLISQSQQPTALVPV